MNKILVLKEKYPKVRESMFDFFVESDKTPTKKYLNYMLKIWSDKISNNITSVSLVNLVQKFDDLLPYIKNKDIYSPDYNKIVNLIKVINEAEILKEEKEFKKDEHIEILIDNEKYLFIRPITHEGSLKYGSNTKWCTAMRNQKKYFDNYTRDGYLCYLISKNTEIKYKKVAFYMPINKTTNSNILSSGFLMYNEPDEVVSDNDMIKNGWDIKDFIEITYIFRLNVLNYKKISDYQKDIKSTILKVKSIDLDDFYSKLQFLEKINNETHEEEKNIISDFLKSLILKIE